MFSWLGEQADFWWGLKEEKVWAKRVLGKTYSTVTDLAKFFGLSTSQPLNTAV